MRRPVLELEQTLGGRTHHSGSLSLGQQPPSLGPSLSRLSRPGQVITKFRMSKSVMLLAKIKAAQKVSNNISAIRILLFLR